MPRPSRWLGLSASLLTLAGATWQENLAECASQQLEYTLSARLEISDTPFGAGDGFVDIGPGRLSLRLTRLPQSPKVVRAELSDYRMQSRFTISSKVLLWSATVKTRTESRVAPGVAGRGTLSGRLLRWSGPIAGYRTDGTLECKGSGCGMPGAPPEGVSELHIGPHAVSFPAFVFAKDDLDTFQMEFASLGHTDQPQQTTRIALAGRKVSAQCLDPRG